MYVYTYICTYVHRWEYSCNSVYISIHSITFIYIKNYMYMYMYMYVVGTSYSVYTCTCTYTGIGVMHVHVCTIFASTAHCSIYMYMYIYTVHECVYMCIHTYTLKKCLFLWCSSSWYCVMFLICRSRPTIKHAKIEKLNVVKYTHSVNMSGGSRSSKRGK